MELTKQEIEAELRSKNTKPTSIRVLIYGFLHTQKTAKSISEIQHHFKHIDRVTAYRTLKTFEEKGIAHGIQESRATKYILCGEMCKEKAHQDWHLHFYCYRCKQISCKKNVVPIQSDVDFEIHEMQFFARGICENCKLQSKPYDL